MALITAQDLYRSRQARLLKESLENYINSLTEEDKESLIILTEKLKELVNESSARERRLLSRLNYFYDVFIK